MGKMPMPPRRPQFGDTSGELGGQRLALLSLELPELSISSWSRRLMTSDAAPDAGTSAPQTTGLNSGGRERRRAVRIWASCKTSSRSNGFFKMEGYDQRCQSGANISSRNNRSTPCRSRREDTGPHPEFGRNLDSIPPRRHSDIDKRQFVGPPLLDGVVHAGQTRFALKEESIFELALGRPTKARWQTTPPPALQFELPGAIPTEDLAKSFMDRGVVINHQKSDAWLWGLG